MVIGIGTDIVDVTRFVSWGAFSRERLEKVFTAQEIHDSCDVSGDIIPEKLAVRFAAKEAFYKALSGALVSMGLTQNQFSFLSTCPYVSVVSGTWQVPGLAINWDFFEKKVGAPLEHLKAKLSLSHEKTVAVAFVVLELE